MEILRSVTINWDGYPYVAGIWYYFIVLFHLCVLKFLMTSSDEEIWSTNWGVELLSTMHAQYNIHNNLDEDIW